MKIEKKIPFDFVTPIDNFRKNSFEPDTVHVEEVAKDRLIEYSKDTMYQHKLVENKWYDKDTGKFNPVTYKTDKFGFRNNTNHIEKGNVVAIGCSDTFGIGNYYEDLWTTKLARILNKEVYNLGIPGGSMDTCFRSLLSFYEIYKPRTVYLLKPSCYRTELWVNYKGTSIHTLLGPNFDLSTHKESKFLSDYQDKVLLCDENVYLNYEKNSLAIQAFCNQKGIKLIEMGNPIFNYTHFNPLGSIFNNRDIADLGYDLNHLGRKYQDYILKEFLKLE